MGEGKGKERDGEATPRVAEQERKKEKKFNRELFFQRGGSPKVEVKKKSFNKCSYFWKKVEVGKSSKSKANIPIDKCLKLW